MTDNPQVDGMVKQSQDFWDSGFGFTGLDRSRIRIYVAGLLLVECRRCLSPAVFQHPTIVRPRVT
jgi:hypothetical protein